jgi:hypothetical protein
MVKLFPYDPKYHEEWLRHSLNARPRHGGCNAPMPATLVVAQATKAKEATRKTNEHDQEYVTV